MTFSISAIIQDGGQTSGNLTFFTGTISKVSSTQRVQTLLKITLSLKVFEINDIFNFCQNSRCQTKFKMATKNGDKAIFVKCHQYTLQIPCGLKISSKSFISNRFQDKFENFNYLNVAFISYKLTLWDCMLFSDGCKASGQRLRKIDIYSWP